MTEHKNTLRFIQFLPGIAWFLFVLALICLPGEDVPEEPGWFHIPHFDKIVHAALFGGIVFWFCMPFKKAVFSRRQKANWFIKITLATVLWGITTEYIQKFWIEGRQFDMVDWVADSAGAIIALLVSGKLFLR